MIKTRLLVPAVLMLLGAHVITAQPQSSELEPSTALEADGKAISAHRDRGHAGPLVRDHDGDGVPDLLVSAYRGNIRFFKNVGTRTAFRFAEQGELAAGDKPIRIHNW